MILIEFNELSPLLLDAFIREGDLPHFARFRAHSAVYITDAGEWGDTLQPWVAWPSVHTGVPAREHRAYVLGDGARIAQPLVGDVLRDAGMRIGIFGSMNTAYREVGDGFSVPDPWCHHGRTTPTRLQGFFDVVAGQVQESVHHGSLRPQQVAALAAQLACGGTSAQTLTRIAGQLLAERRSGGALRWRRASVLDALQYDVFRDVHRRTSPAFATFFSNSTAHYQHYYWRNMEPAEFAEPPPSDDHDSLRGAIRYGYRAMDELIGRFVDDFPNHVLIFATALSQRADHAQPVQGIRPKSFAAFLAFADLPLDPSACVPVMAEQFHIVCRDEGQARNVDEALARLAFDDGSPLMAHRSEETGVFAGARYVEGGGPPLSARAIVDRRGAMVPLLDVFEPLPGRRSGTHDPAGALWIRTGHAATFDAPVPIEAIAPSLLRHFGVARPATMRERDDLMLAADEKNPAFAGCAW